jgi:hypothetical protein
VGRTQTTIAFVETGLQALNLVEYQAATGDLADLVVIPVDPGNGSSEQALDVLRFFGVRLPIYRQQWHGGWLKPGRNAESALDELLALASRVAPVGRLILGEYRLPLNWTFARALDLTGADIVVVDDGTATLRINRVDGITGDDMPGPASGLPYAPLDGVTFFSSYADALHASPHDTVIENRREMLRSRYADLPADESVVFVMGSPLVESGIMAGGDIDIALALVDEARRWRPNAMVAYVPHRRESPAKRRTLGHYCDVIDFARPYELVPPQVGRLPSHYVGTFSSLFGNLASLAPDRLHLRAYRIPEQAISPQHRAGVARCYDDLAQPGIDVHMIDPADAATSGAARNAQAAQWEAEEERCE